MTNNLTEEKRPSDCETLGKEHEWEKVEYDPSVGILTSGRVCVVCERFEPYD